MVDVSRASPEARRVASLTRSSFGASRRRRRRAPLSVSPETVLPLSVCAVLMSAGGFACERKAVKALRSRGPVDRLVRGGLDQPCCSLDGRRREVLW
jgi:hypothetical protein